MTMVALFVAVLYIIQLVPYCKRVPIVNYFADPPTCPKVRVTRIHRPLWVGLEFPLGFTPPGQSGLPKSKWTHPDI